MYLYTSSELLMSLWLYSSDISAVLKALQLLPVDFFTVDLKMVIPEHIIDHVCVPVTPNV